MASSCKSPDSGRPPLLSNGKFPERASSHSLNHEQHITLTQSYCAFDGVSTFQPKLFSGDFLEFNRIFDCRTTRNEILSRVEVVHEKSSAKGFKGIFIAKRAWWNSGVVDVPSHIEPLKEFGICPIVVAFFGHNRMNSVTDPTVCNQSFLFFIITKNCK